MNDKTQTFDNQFGILEYSKFKLNLKRENVCQTILKSFSIAICVNCENNDKKTSDCKLMTCAQVYNFVCGRMAHYS